MEGRGEQELLKEIQYLTSIIISLINTSEFLCDILFGMMADLIQSHGSQGSTNIKSTSGAVSSVSANQYHWKSQYVAFCHDIVKHLLLCTCIEAYVSFVHTMQTLTRKPFSCSKL